MLRDGRRLLPPKPVLHLEVDRFYFYFLSMCHHTNNVHHNSVVSGGSKADTEKGPRVKSPIIMYPHHIALPDYENKLNVPFLKADIDGN